MTERSRLLPFFSLGTVIVALTVPLATLAMSLGQRFPHSIVAHAHWAAAATTAMVVDLFGIALAVYALVRRRRMSEKRSIAKVALVLGAVLLVACAFIAIFAPSFGSPPPTQT